MFTVGEKVLKWALLLTALSSWFAVLMHFTMSAIPHDQHQNNSTVSMPIVHTGFTEDRILNLI